MNFPMGAIIPANDMIDLHVVDIGLKAQANIFPQAVIDESIGRPETTVKIELGPELQTGLATMSILVTPSEKNMEATMQAKGGCELMT